jgi:hypothetical protein
MMIRWSTDACRRDPSIVSSNLTNPTFSEDLFSPESFLYAGLNPLDGVI